MPTRVRPRFGSLQYWPRKRAAKAIPSANWNALKDKGEGFQGFIGYKAGMGTAIVKDDTPQSMTKGKRKAIAATVLEVPAMKIFSVRFYKDGKVMKDVIVANDKELKKKVKVPKTLGNLEGIEGFDDVRVIMYSLVKQTSVKKKPDMIEVGINASDKLAFVKEWIGKEITLADTLKEKVVDVRGLTKGKGTQGPVRRFGITLKRHKSEKGRRNPGSLGPWHPARVTFRVPMSGQLGQFSRVHYNLPVLSSGSIADKDINRKEGFKNYGKLKTNYVILAGSVQGSTKRQIFVTAPLRPTKKQNKKNYELVEFH